MGWATVPRAALAAGVVFLAGTAGAHEFECEKRVNGASTYTITTYPADLYWALKIRNTHATHASTATSLQDDMLQSLGFVFYPAAPLTLQVGEYQMWNFHHVVNSKYECEVLAASDGLRDGNIDNVFKVGWDSGFDECHARVVCGDQPPPPGGTTRTMGFFKTHLVPLQACIDEGAIDLGPGFQLIDTIEEALGVLWGSPDRFDDGTERDDLERARFLLARQTLVGVCNTRLFDAVPSPFTLIADALAALQGTDCALIHALAEDVDAFNNSGTDGDFPAGVTRGPASPRQARQLAEDPSIDTHVACGSTTTPVE